MTQSYAARAVGRGVFSQPLLYCQHFRRMHILCGCVEVTPRLVHAYHRWSPRSSCTVPGPKAITPLSHFSRVLCAKVRTVSSMAMLWGYGKVHQSPGPTAHQKKNDDFTNDHWLNKQQLYTTSASPHEGDSVSFRAAVPGTCMSQSKVRCTTTLPARSKRTGT